MGNSTMKYFIWGLCSFSMMLVFFLQSFALTRLFSTPKSVVKNAAISGPVEQQPRTSERRDLKAKRYTQRSSTIVAAHLNSSLSNQPDNSGQDPYRGSKPSSSQRYSMSPELLEIADYHIVESNHYRFINSDETDRNRKEGKDDTSDLPNNSSPATEEKPNFILFLFDDSGFGDLGANHIEANPEATSSTSSRKYQAKLPSSSSPTPFLDLLAKKGLRLSDFYVLSSTCTPSRAGLLTGRYGMRSGVIKHIPPFSSGGLPPSEITIASHLKNHGYKTIMLGKWHLGHIGPHLPTSHGFDEWIGLPFSNDMACVDAPLGGVHVNSAASAPAHACPLSTADYDRENPWTSRKSSYLEPPVLPLYHTCATYNKVIGNKEHDENRKNLSQLSKPDSEFNCEDAVYRTTLDVNKDYICDASGKQPSKLSLSSGSIREQPTNLWRLSDRLVNRAISFIRENTQSDKAVKSNKKTQPNSQKQMDDADSKKSKAVVVDPFFVYFPLIHTHVPHTPKIKHLQASLKALGLEETSLQTEKEYGDYLESKRRAKFEKSKDSTNQATVVRGAVSDVEKATYGAALREGDEMVQQVMQALEQIGGSTYENTFTVVMSDNGPWLEQDIMGGSPLPYRGGKFSTFEGGVRVFCIFHWPRVFGDNTHQHLKELEEEKGNNLDAAMQKHSQSNPSRALLSSSKKGVSSSLLVSSLDLLPTFMSLARIPLQPDRSYDGSDLSSFIFHAGEFKKLYHRFATKFNNNDGGNSDLLVMNHLETLETKNTDVSDFLHQRSKLLSRVFRARSVIMQSMGALTAMRIGRYKVHGLDVVAVRPNSKEVFEVFDLEKDPLERSPLKDHLNQKFYLPKLKNGNHVKASNNAANIDVSHHAYGVDQHVYLHVEDEEYMELSFDNFSAIIINIRERLAHDIQSTKRSNNIHKAPQASKFMPCAGNFQGSHMCVKCQCSSSVVSTASSKKNQLVRNC